MNKKTILIVGLGNPGKEYEKTRHNVGWMVLDLLQSELHMPDFSLNKKFHAAITTNNNLVLIKPQTFMNDSGLAVQSVLSFYHLDQSSIEIVVIHDDLDIEVGKYKLMFGKGPKVHNGLLSMYQHLKTDQFWHLRIGVDGRQGDRSLPGHAYVLQTFTSAEQQQLPLVLAKAVEELKSKYSIV